VADNCKVTGHVHEVEPIICADKQVGSVDKRTVHKLDGQLLIGLFVALLDHIDLAVRVAHDNVFFRR